MSNANTLVSGNVDILTQNYAMMAQRIMEKAGFIEKVYGKYQLVWMIDHGYSLYDIFQVFFKAEDVCKQYNITDTEGVLLAAKDYFMENGFNGELFNCYDDFVENEFMDVAYMYRLLSKAEFMEYLKVEEYETFERFSVQDDGSVIIQEMGYVTEDSATGNPEDTSRIVKCYGATFRQQDLTGDIDKDTEMIDVMFSNCREYVEDVTDQRLYDHVYDWLGRYNVKVGDYCEKGLKAGEYVKFI